MRVRFAFLVLLAAVGCESLRPAAPSPVAKEVAQAPVRVAAPIPQPPRPPAEVLRASATESPTAEPQAPVVVDSLALAAQCIERNDLPGATTHLDTYVRTHLDQPLYRLQLAEL